MKRYLSFVPSTSVLLTLVLFLQQLSHVSTTASSVRNTRNSGFARTQKAMIAKDDQRLRLQRNREEYLSEERFQQHNENLDDAYNAKSIRRRRRTIAESHEKHRAKNRRHLPDLFAFSTSTTNANYIGAWDKELEIGRRHADDFQRHPAKYSYPISMTNSLMLSPCRPDANGYFGSTHGSYTELEYRFELYTLQGLKSSKRDEILRVMDDMVMDAVLSHVFPTVCAFDEKQEGTAPDFSSASKDFQVMGFYFGIQDTPLDVKQYDGEEYEFSFESPNEKRKVQACESGSSSEDGTGFPLNNNNQNNKEEQEPWECRVYTSTVKVFGKGNTAQSVPAISQMIFQAIEQSLARTGPLGAEYVHSVGSIIRVSHDGDDNINDSGPPSSNDENSNHHNIIKIIMTVVMALVIVFVIGLFWYLRREAVQYYSDGKWDHSTVTTTIGSLLFFSSNGTHVDDQSRQGTKRQQRRSDSGSRGTSRSSRHEKSSRKSRSSGHHPHASSHQMKAVPGTAIQQQHQHPLQQQKRVIIEFSADYYDDSQDLYAAQVWNGDVASYSSSLPSDYYDRSLNWEEDVSAPNSTRARQQYQQQQQQQRQHQHYQQQQHHQQLRPQNQRQQSQHQHRHQREQQPLVRGQHIEESRTSFKDPCRSSSRSSRSRRSEVARNNDY